MTTMNPTRGELWEVRFDPSEGDEIKKVRPAVVMGITGAGRLELQIVVPITAWQNYFKDYFWMVRIMPKAQNGLAKESAADTFQVKSLSIARFQKKLGVLADEDLSNVTKALAVRIGYRSKI